MRLQEMENALYFVLGLKGVMEAVQAAGRVSPRQTQFTSDKYPIRSYRLARHYGTLTMVLGLSPSYGC